MTECVLMKDIKERTARLLDLMEEVINDERERIKNETETETET